MSILRPVRLSFLSKPPNYTVIWAPRLLGTLKYVSASWTQEIILWPPFEFFGRNSRNLISALKHHTTDIATPVKMNS